MKKAIIILTLLLFTLNAYAQNFIGVSKNNLIKILEKGGDVSLVKEDNVGDGKTILLYSDNNIDGVYRMYHLQNGVCENYVIIYPKKLLSMVIKSYNDIYIRQSTYEWVDHELTLKLTLRVDRDDVIAMRFDSLK